MSEQTSGPQEAPGTRNESSIRGFVLLGVAGYVTVAGFLALADWLAMVPYAHVLAGPNLRFGMSASLWSSPVWVPLALAARAASRRLTRGLEGWDLAIRAGTTTAVVAGALVGLCVAVLATDPVVALCAGALSAAWFGRAGAAANAASTLATYVRDCRRGN
jgi:hypothetical protein